MSDTTFAMPLSIDGPLPVAPEHCLLSIPGVLIDPEDVHWASGAVVYGYPTATPTNWDPCTTGTTRSKSDDSEQPLPHWSAFTTYVAITCSAMSIGDPDEFKQRAVAVLEATESFAVERALSQGVPDAGSPFFLDGNESLPAGTSAVTSEVGLAYLEEAIGSTGRAGMIHLSPGVVSRLGFNFLREEEDEGPITTTAGVPIAPGGGYVGAHRLGHTAPAAGQSWGFATGPVQVRHSETFTQEIWEALERTENLVTFRAERDILATWDTALQAAVLIDWSTP